MKEFDLEELAKFNGEDGKPTYVALHGRVLDVSGSKLWKNGLHMKRHHAGRDLTTDIQAAPHSPEMLARFPQVGLLRKEAPERAIPEALATLLRRFPLLRRHPHPMTVHFPIVFMFSTTVFNLISLITGIKAFETTALHCLGAGLLFTLVAIATGLYTWWLNYMAKPLMAVVIKKRVSIIMFIAAFAAFIWRILAPGILDSSGIGSVFYLVLVLSLFPLATVIGWFGASLTFPIEKE